jgi:hypothetical protein
MPRSAIHRHFTGLSKNTFLLALASLFADVSTEMLYPVLPVFLTQTLKASGSIVGFVDGFAQATQNIVQGFSGALSDKLQKRKSIALAGYLLAAVAKPLMGLSTVWQGVFGARLLDRIPFLFLLTPLEDTLQRRTRRAQAQPNPKVIFCVQGVRGEPCGMPRRLSRASVVRYERRWSSSPGYGCAISRTQRSPSGSTTA